MERSFGLEFNPLMNVKSVKDYEQEIEDLRAENFELKTRLTHTSGDNIPKILYEQSEQFARLEQTRAELARQNEELHRTVTQLSQEKTELEKRYNNDLLVNSERMGLLEDENKRLLLKLERNNKEIGEVDKFKELLKESERLNNEYKCYIQNEEGKWEQERFEHKRQVDALQAHITEIKTSYERELSTKTGEIANLRNVIETEINRNKSNTLMINDLKTTLNNELRNKETLKEELERLKGVGTKASELEKYVQDQKREGEIYLAGMDKLRKIVTERLTEIGKKLKVLSESVQDVSKLCLISEDNRKFLLKMKIGQVPVDQVVTNLRTLLREAYSRIDILKRETKDATFFAENSKRQQTAKTMRILEEFKAQFTAAKNELLECRKYLEKKALENKELKNENSRLRKCILNAQHNKNATAIVFGSKNPLKL